MDQKVHFTENVTLYPTATDVKFGEHRHLGFTIAIFFQKDGKTTYELRNIKGDFEIAKIVSTAHAKNIPIVNNKFSISDIDGRYLTFYITANIEISLKNEPICIKSKPTTPVMPEPTSPPVEECRPKYADTLDLSLIAADGTKIPTHRNIFVKASTRWPISFKCEKDVIVFNDFNASTIRAVVYFLYGTKVAINGNEMEVYKFADKYGFLKLAEECCSRFEKLVDSSNVHDYIQIAYKYDIESFKEKCLKIWIENGKKFSYAETSCLPQNILADISFWYQQRYYF